MAVSEGSSVNMEAQIRTLIEQQMETQNQRMAALETQILEKIAQLTKERTMEVNEENSSNTDRNAFRFLPKLEFPSFDGTNPRHWIKKCSRYFALCKIPDDQRLDVASIHLVGKAETWFTSYIAVRKNVDWSDFIVDVCSRFREELGSKVVEEFHKLYQMGSLDAYLERFEELKSLLLQSIPTLPDDYFVSSFIGGLKPQLKPFVRALNPLSLDDAIRFARLHEEVGDSVRFNQKPFPAKAPLLANPRVSSGSGGLGGHTTHFTAQRSAGTSTPTGSSSGSGSTRSVNQTFQPTRLISAAERADKIAKGLCYFCDNPYERGHRCPTKKSQLFLVKVPAEIPEEESLVEEGQANPIDNQAIDNQAIGFEMLESEPCISLQALNGIQGYHTMRVTGYVGKKAIHILIDSGSTHNFLNQGLAQRLGCKAEAIHSQAIAVADGSELNCKYVCHNFTWRLQNTTFCSDVLLIPLGSCDMVLGIQWLSQLGTIQWNFNTLHMEFS